MTCNQRENDQGISGRDVGLKTICIYSIGATSGLNTAHLERKEWHSIILRNPYMLLVIASLFTVCENKEIVKKDDNFILRVWMLISLNL